LFGRRSAAYPREPLGASTPTHYALLELQRRIELAMSNEPSFILLATDGRPNLCDFHDGVPATAATEQDAVSTVQQLAAAGTKTFALSMAGNDADLLAHLQAVATTGATGSPAFTPTDQDGLSSALAQIFGGVQTCEVSVKGSIVSGKECSGDVRLNDAPLHCETDYRVGNDRMTLELLGDACATFQQGSESRLTVNFACDEIIFL
jgi:hypothetical protein